MNLRILNKEKRSRARPICNSIPIDMRKKMQQQKCMKPAHRRSLVKHKTEQSQATNRSLICLQLLLNENLYNFPRRSRLFYLIVIRMLLL